ncbi:tetratricopeptide repeat protein [Chloroflexota bacterium]
MKYVTCFILLLLVSITSCDFIESSTGLDLPDSDAYEYGEVVKSADFEERVEAEQYPINNCQCQTVTDLTISRQRTLEESVEQGIGADVGFSLSAMSFAEFSTVVGTEYGMGHSTSVTDGGHLKLTADPGTYPVYTVAWRETWGTGYVVVNHKGKEEKVYYSFLKSAQPEILNVEYRNCDGTGTTETPDNLTHYERGEAAYFEGDYETVIAEMTLVIQAVPDKASAYIYRGLAYYYQELYGEAITDYTIAIQLDPDSYIAYYDRGLVYYQQIQYSHAIADFNEAIELHPGYIDAYFYRGVCLYEKGFYGKALIDLDRAIELDSGYTNAYYWRALNHKLMGNEAEAIADFETYINLSDSPEWIEQALNEIEALK